jgi:hypothetical protein
MPTQGGGVVNGSRTVPAIVAGIGLLFFVITAVGFFSSFIPYRPEIPIVWTVIGVMCVWQARLLWPSGTRPRSGLTRESDDE